MRDFLCTVDTLWGFCPTLVGYVRRALSPTTRCLDRGVNRDGLAPETVAQLEAATAPSAFSTSICAPFPAFSRLRGEGRGAGGGRQANPAAPLTVRRYDLL
ncbi:MAG: hypothetical protein NVSMB18_23560 [Acetobacteraceae bacterium]